MGFPRGHRFATRCGAAVRSMNCTSATRRSDEREHKGHQSPANSTGRINPDRIEMSTWPTTRERLRSRPSRCLEFNVILNQRDVDMKKFINRPENAVEEMLQGLAVLHPGLIRLPGHKVLYRADAEKVRDQQIAIISGGGSGHEPAHAGYVGAGMLSSGVAGEVFTSPDTDSIFAAIKAVAGKPGALLVVKN